MKPTPLLLACLIGLAFPMVGPAQPTITVQPQSQTNVVGSTLPLSVEAAGVPPLTYQWRKASTPVAGATNAALVFTNVQSSQAGNYTVTITNVEGAVTSAVAFVRVLVPPAITTQPTNFPTLSLGASVGNRVAASGTAPLYYQWRLNGTNLLGEANASLAIANLQLPNAGAYTAVVTNSAGSVTSVVVTLFIDSTFTKITAGDVVSKRLNSRGCAWGDFDNDGLLDLFVANRDGQNESLFRNLGEGRFARITSGPVVSSGGDSMGGGWCDADNDGNLDLFVLNANGENEFLFWNQGGGTFTRVTNAAPGTPSNDGGHSVSSSWADYDRDGFPDLVVVNPGGPNVLYHGNGDRSFTKITTGSLVTTVDSHHGCAWADFDNDGDPDLFVSAYGDRGNLYQNTAGILLAVAATTIHLEPASSLGPAWGDYDNDGFPDLFVANGGSIDGPKNNFLYRNKGDGTFASITTGRIVTDRESSDGCAWGDYDADGFLDLFVTNVSGENNSMYHNNGDGTFTKIITGSLVQDGSDSRGCAWGDFDNDGFLDLYVANGSSQNNFLYRNTGNTNRWLTVRLIGTISNRDAIGAKVRVQAKIGGRSMWQLREVSGGSGRASQNDLRAHFGLGDATIIDTLRIEWPSGIVQELRDVAPKQFLTVTEPRDSRGCEQVSSAFHHGRGWFSRCRCRRTWTNGYLSPR